MENSKGLDRQIQKEALEAKLAELEVKEKEIKEMRKQCESMIETIKWEMENSQIMDFLEERKERIKELSDDALLTKIQKTIDYDDNQSPFPKSSHNELDMIQNCLITLKTQFQALENRVNLYEKHDRIRNAMYKKTKPLGELLKEDTEPIGNLMAQLCHAKEQYKELETELAENAKNEE